MNKRNAPKAFEPVSQVMFPGPGPGSGSGAGVLPRPGSSFIPPVRAAVYTQTLRLSPHAACKPVLCVLSFVPAVMTHKRSVCGVSRSCMLLASELRV